jgi:hypothetical protein
VPAAQELLGLQAAYVAGPTPARRDAVVAAARALTTTVLVGARAEPRSAQELGLALLREQRETNRLLGLLMVSPPFLAVRLVADAPQTQSVRDVGGKKRKRGE